MANNNTFQSLSGVSESYDTKRGKEFRAQFTGFAAKDAEIQAVGDRYAVKTFTNLSGSKELLEKGLGVELVENEFEGKNGTVLSIPSNLTIWVNTKEEAEFYANRVKKNTRVSSPVRVHSREYNDKIYLEMDVDTIFIHQGGGGGSMAPAAGSKSAAEIAAEDDLPF